MNTVVYTYILSLSSLAVSLQPNKAKELRALDSKGRLLNIYEYPYACFLHFKNTRPTSCGASLIMIQAVLTAAHCMNDLRYENGEIYAYFGSDVPNDAVVVRRVKSYEINPKYNEMKGKNNLAVAFLRFKVPLHKLIKTIPMAIKDPPPGTRTFSVGWGKQSLGKLGDFSNLRPLKLTVQRLLSLQECNQVTGYNTAADILCTLPIIGEHYKDDAGDGLISGRPRTLIGVLSYVTNSYSVYTGVASERDWIMKACGRLNHKNCFPNKVLH